MKLRRRQTKKSSLIWLLIKSHILLWRRIFFCWRSVFIQATTECCIPLESARREDLKKMWIRPSVRLSVCPVRSFVTLTKKAYSSFIIDSRKIIRMSGERAWHNLPENEAIFSNIYFSKKLDWIFEKLHICIKNAGSSLIINSRIIICISDERFWHPLQENEKILKKLF